MTFLSATPDGYFEIAREPANIPFETFWDRYVVTEQPFIIEHVAAGWKAATCWTERYLQKRLSEEPLAKEAFLWYWLQKNGLNGDYETPAIVEQAITDGRVFPRTQAMRIWVHEKGNVSSWHYDANMVSVFNVQVTGRKKWALISPETPLACYPFTNFVIMDGKGEALFRNKIHTHFVLNEGDMLYLPPLWFHQVEACEQENISLNWVFTKKETRITSDTFERDFDRYWLADYFLKHRFALFRNLFKAINAKLPNYLRIIWQYPQLIQSDYRVTGLDLVTRLLKELSVLAKVLMHINKIKRYLKQIKPVSRLERAVQSSAKST